MVFGLGLRLESRQWLSFNSNFLRRNTQQSPEFEAGSVPLIASYTVICILGQRSAS